MREPNLGTYLYCSVCGKRYWSEDGWSFCSQECEEAIECPHCGNDKEVDEKYCYRCTTCPECGDEKNPQDEYCYECEEKLSEEEEK